MRDLKQAAIELQRERAKLEGDIAHLIAEFESKTGFYVKEFITSESGWVGDKVIRAHSVKLAL